MILVFRLGPHPKVPHHLLCRCSPRNPNPTARVAQAFRVGPPHLSRSGRSSPSGPSCFPPGVLTLQLEHAAKKRERTTSDPRTLEQKQEKKRLRTSKKPKDSDPPEKDFTPFDYSQSDFKAFAGEDRTGAPLRDIFPCEVGGSCPVEKAQLRHSSPGPGRGCGQ